MGYFFDGVVGWLKIMNEIVWWYKMWFICDGKFDVFCEVVSNEYYFVVYEFDVVVYVFDFSFVNLVIYKYWVCGVEGG